MGKYFQPFPTTSYANVECVDIIRSNEIKQSILRNTSLYYNFIVREGQRPDTLSYDYYDTPYFDWLVYKSNNIVDPYYDWYMTQSTFDSYMVSKYGSIERAIETTLFYYVNWQTNDQRLTAAGYQALGSKQRPYWRPGTDAATYFVRKELDWKVSTNMIVKVPLTSVSAVSLNDYVAQYDTQNGGTSNASGEVSFVGSDYILVRCVTGTFTNGKWISANPFAVSGLTYTQINDTPTIMEYTIPQEVSVYWTKMSAYDYELTLNEEKKNIKLISKEYSKTIQREHEVSIGNG